MISKKMLLSILTIAFVAIGIAGATWAYLPSNVATASGTAITTTAPVLASVSLTGGANVAPGEPPVSLGSATVTSTAPGQVWITGISVTGLNADHLRVYDQSGHLLWANGAQVISTPVFSGVTITDPTAGAVVSFTYSLDKADKDQTDTSGTAVSVNLIQHGYS